MKKILFLNLAIILFSACKSGKSQDTDAYSTSFFDQVYQLNSIDGKSVAEMNLKMTVATEQNSISGETGCNNYQFTYNLEGENLDLGYGVATKMYCQDNMETEKALFSAASQVKHFRQTSDMLYLLNEEGKVMLEAKAKK